MSRATRQLQHAVAGTVALAAATLFAPAAVRADFPLPLPHEIHAEVRAHVHDVLRSIGRIPEQIAHGHAEHLQVFFGGNSYYGPHRHQHVIYNFPVSIGNEVYYRPYTYCNDRLFGDYDFGSYSYRPQLWVGWGLDSHSRWCSHHRTYYPAAHSCFRSNHYRSSRNWARSSSYDSCDHRSRSCTHRNGYRSGSGHDRRWDRRDGRDGRGDGRAHPRQWSQQNPSYRQPVENRTWNDRRAPLQRRPEVRNQGNDRRREWSHERRSERPQVRSHDSSRRESKSYSQPHSRPSSKSYSKPSAKSQSKPSAKSGAKHDSKSSSKGNRQGSRHRNN
jgi:hypothetical protein